MARGVRYRVAAALVAVLVLCALAGAASGSRTADAVSDRAPIPALPVAGDQAVKDFTLPVALLLVAIVVAAGAGVLANLLSGAPRRRDEDEAVESGFEVAVPPWLRYLIVVLIALATIVGSMALLTGMRALTGQQQGRAAEPGEQVDDGTTDPSSRTADDDAGRVESPSLGESPGTLALMVLGLAAVVWVALYLLGRSRWRHGELPQVRLPDQPPAVESLADVPIDPLAIDVEALERGDPRDAVIKAWASADHIVAEAGFPREWGETAAELVRRVGPSLPGSGPATLARLSSVFHEAKFSTHAIDETKRRLAIDSLLELCDTLGPLVRSTGVPA